MACEATLVASAQRGDAEAFEALVRPLQKTIFRLGLRITGSPEDADEVLQESLFKAWKNLRRFQGSSRFSTWMVSIGRKEALMKLRKNRSDRFITVDDSVDDDGEVRPWIWHDQRPNPEQLLLQTEVRSLFLEVAETLNLPSRRVFLLRYLDGLSTRETGRELKLRSTAVKSRAHRARNYMRLELSKKLRIRQMPSGTARVGQSVLMKA